MSDCLKNVNLIATQERGEGLPPKAGGISRIQTVVHQVLSSRVWLAVSQSHSSPIAPAGAQVNDQIPDVVVDAQFRNHQPLDAVENPIPFRSVAEQLDEGGHTPTVFAGIAGKGGRESVDRRCSVHFRGPIRGDGWRRCRGRFRGDGRRRGRGRWFIGEVGRRGQQVISIGGLVQEANRRGYPVHTVWEDRGMELTHDGVGAHGFSKPASHVDAGFRDAIPLPFANQADRRHEAAVAIRGDDVPPVFVGVILIVHHQHAISVADGYLVIAQFWCPIRDGTSPLHAIVCGRAAPLATHVSSRWH